MAARACQWMGPGGTILLGRPVTVGIYVYIYAGSDGCPGLSRWAVIAWTRKEEAQSVKARSVKIKQRLVR